MPKSKDKRERKEKYSSCCGAGVDEEKLICLECKEHCGIEVEDSGYCQHVPEPDSETKEGDFWCKKCKQWYMPLEELQKTTERILSEVESIVLDRKDEGIYIREKQDIVKRLQLFLKKYKGV